MSVLEVHQGYVFFQVYCKSATLPKTPKIIATKYFKRLWVVEGEKIFTQIFIGAKNYITSKSVLLLFTAQCCMF